MTPTYKSSQGTTSKKLVFKFPQKKQETLNPEIVIDWAKQNGFEISFVSPTPKLKSKLHYSFGDVMVSDVVNENKTHNTLNEEINNSGLPDFVKQWATNNPERFLENIQRIKKLLK